MAKYIFTINENLTKAQKMGLVAAIGGVQKGDYGKRVYDMVGYWSVESNEQRDKRLAEEQKSAENLTIEQFISKHGLGFECKRVENRPDGLMDGDWGNEDRVTTLAQDKMRHFKCRITGGPKAEFGRSMGLYFSQGSGHTADPTLADVLDCLASDTSGYEGVQQGGNPDDIFENWASEYGYDTDSRKAEKTYKAIKRQAEQMRRTLGDAAYDELLYNTERA